MRLGRAAEPNPNGVHTAEVGTAAECEHRSRGDCLTIGGAGAALCRDPIFVALAPSMEHKKAAALNGDI